MGGDDCHRKYTLRNSSVEPPLALVSSAHLEGKRVMGAQRALRPAGELWLRPQPAGLAPPRLGVCTPGAGRATLLADASGARGGASGCPRSQPVESMEILGEIKKIK